MPAQRLQLGDLTNALLVPDDDRPSRVAKLTSLAHALPDASDPPTPQDIARAARLSAHFDQESLVAGPLNDEFMTNYAAVKTYEGELVQKAVFAKDKNVLDAEAGEAAGAAEGGTTYEEQVAASGSQVAKVLARGIDTLLDEMRKTRKDVGKNRKIIRKVRKTQKVHDLRITDIANKMRDLEHATRRSRASTDLDNLNAPLPARPPLGPIWRDDYSPSVSPSSSDDSSDSDGSAGDPKRRAGAAAASAAQAQAAAQAQVGGDRRRGGGFGGFGGAARGRGRGTRNSSETPRRATRASSAAAAAAEAEAAAQAFAAGGEQDEEDDLYA
ncbi:hypothetical protein NBRC10512_006482 [Rhodotorula toruloides]|uniref:RHTO0S01e03202g1_1 n=2 Tax=Rhodotorula toruloides TaxID=5286 RepID=A0A061AEN8_RHOTO|nr:uncharacterized protein RHTO_04022 [Rhodotorula toruloides NP11]EMS19730.1 hypothetical protein RHTO_04022 [Rhodotorula toruloides NP11]KAJ8292158.1 hypothetical protein OF846_004484 [Rhodotorula toruloides]CDR35610.1 RHTO0S01e03202g1_1 [Rhodotorula toruloides]